MGCGSICIGAMNPAPAKNSQSHQEHPAKRIRGGGAAKVRFLKS